MFGEINVVRTEKMEIENRGPQLLAVNISLLTVALVAMLLRCYVRIHMVKAFGLDDWLMLLASISFVSYCSFSITGVHYGTGRHKEDLTEESNARAKMFWWCCYLAYCFTMILCKLSIGWFLLRVTVRRLHKWIIYAASVITVITCMAFFFVSIFQCHPVSYFWDKYTQDGTCVNIEVIIGLAYLYSTCSVITDFTFALLPAWIISQLKMKRTTKIALIPLLSMGCVASAAVVVRFAYLPNFRSPDFLWATLDIAIWSTIEQGLGITAGSLATLRPLLKLVGYKLGLTTKPSHMPSYYGKMGGASNQGQGTGSRRRGSQSAHDVLGLDTFPAHNTSFAFTQHEKSFEGTIEAGVIENLAEDKSGDKRRSYWKVKPLHSDSESIEALRAEHSGEGVDDHRKEMRSFWVADNNSK